MAQDRAGLTEDGALGVRKAAEFVSLSKSTLYSLMDAGQLAYSKCGKRRLIPRRALVELLARNLKGGWATEDGRGREASRD